MKRVDFQNIPGNELVSQGLKDISEGNYHSEYALLLFMAAPRLRYLGIHIPRDPRSKETNPSHELYRLLENTTPDPYSQFNALQRRLVSFCNAMESVSRI